MVDNITLENYSFWNFKGEVDYVDKWFLMSSPLPILSIWILYLAFVLKIGPDFMKKRPPFSLNNFLIFYNVFQIIFSCFVFYVGYYLLEQTGFLFQRNCLTDSHDLKHYTAVGIYYYFFAKLTELFDTVFFVLRKRDRQVTFLHVYHHSITLLSSWFALKYDPSYSSIFLGTINSFVHIIMYTYYGLSAFPDLTKYLWWKKYLTTMQLVQFLLIVFQAAVNYKVSSCQTSNALLLTIVLNATLFLYLFGDFYLKSYHNKNERNTEITNGIGVKNEEKSQSNNSMRNPTNNRYINKND